MPSAPLPRIYAAVLGPVQLVVDGTPVDLRGPRPRTLLASLVLARGRTVPLATLVEDLWGDETPHDPRASLHTAVSRLRATTTVPFLSSEPTGYRLSCPSDLDLAALLVTEAEAALAADDPTTALHALDRAGRLWRGDIDVPDALAADLTARDNDLRHQLDHARLRAWSATGRHDEAVRVAENLTARRPTDEAAQLGLMRAYAASGRRNDALRAFAQVREALADELGTSPGPALVRLNAELLRSDGATESAPTGPASPGSTETRITDLTPPSPGTSRSIGLRVPPNDLLGRDGDLAELLLALDRHRLVTVLGPGGLGKTRIAQSVAARIAPTGRVVVVELAGIRSDEDVELAIASALGVREEGTSRRLGDQVPRTDLSTRIVDRLSETPTLLVLDNCEHVIVGAAAWVHEVLAAVPTLRVLTTSRSPLQVAGERPFPLGPLASAVADGPGPAVELFRARATAVRPDVHLPAELVARLCDRLDGLPLAIELAAARVRTLSVREIDERLVARFDLLSGGDRSAPERHQTLQAVIDWSWNLLTETERAVARRVAVFPSSFGALGAEVVGTLNTDGRTVLRASVPILDVLDALTAQSLLTVTESPDTGEVRFRMLETVREFGELRAAEAGETAATREAYLAWAIGHAHREWPRLTGRSQVHAMASARQEQENLLHALRWGLSDGRGDVVLAVFAHLGMFWSLRGAHSEVAAIAPEIMAAMTGWPIAPEDAGTATVLFLLILATTFTSDVSVSRRARGRLHRLVRSPAQIDPEVRDLAEFSLGIRDLDSLGPLLAERRRTTSGFVGHVVHMTSAQTAENDGDLDRATGYAEVAYRLAVEAENTWAQASAAMFLGQLASEQARATEALRWIAIARAGLAAVQADVDLDELHWMEAANQAALGHVDAAQRAFDTLLTPERTTGWIFGVSEVQMRAVAEVGRAEITYLRGDLPAAVELYASALRDDVRGPLRNSPWHRIFLAGAVCLAVLAEDDRAPGFAIALRARALAVHRLSPLYTDHPVFGTTVLALGSYLSATTALDRIDDGLELLHLAARLGSRQDLRSQLRSTHLDAARRRHGDARVAAAKERVAAVAPEDLVATAVDVVRRGPWRP